MIIGYIITKSKIDIGPEFKIVKSMGEIIHKDLPILIVGYEDAIDYYGKEQINVLNHQISEKLFWTFEKNVKRNVYESDLEDFIQFCFLKSIEDIVYIDLDLIQYTKHKIRRIVKQILSINDAITYKSNNNIIYIYFGNLIFGIDLNIADFIGYDINKIENKIKEKSLVFLTGKEIFIEYNDQLERLNYELKYIPFLYSLNLHEQ